MLSKSHLKIAFVVKGFPTLSQTFIINQIAALIQTGHQVDIFAFKRGETSNLHPKIVDYNLLDKVTYRDSLPLSRKKRFKELCWWVRRNFLKIHWVDFLISLKLYKLKKANFLKLFYDSKWFLAGKNYDIIHAHFGDNAVPIAELKSKGLLRNSKFIVTFHGYDLTPSLVSDYKKLYQVLFQEADAITVNTLYTKKLLKKVNPLLNNINILPVGLNTNFFKKKNNDDRKKFIILFCGRLIKLKGPDILVPVFQELLNRAHENIKLEIIGEGEMRGRIEEQIKNNKLERQIQLLGALGQKEIREKMSLSSLLLLPATYDPRDARTETQGLVVQEAQAMELPVIISDAGGMKDGLIDGETGFVVQEKDIKGFADAIEKLIRDENLRKLMGEKGRKFVVDKYDSTVLNDQLLQIYKA